MARLARGKWDTLGTLHRLRLGPYVVVLRYDHAWVCQSAGLGLEARSDHGYDCPAEMYGDDVERARAWCLRMVSDRLDERAREDAQAREDLGRMEVDQ